MNPENRQRLRRAFAQDTLFFVRLKTDGFEIDGQAYSELTGRILKTILIRKLFEDGAMVCQSKDGRTAENGTACEACKTPRCRPILRIQLAEQNLRYLVDLNASSAHNLFALEDRLLADGRSLADTHVKLTVRTHGHWGEVLFQPLP
jgi:hypothetical protein